MSIGFVRSHEDTTSGKENDSSFAMSGLSKSLRRIILQAPGRATADTRWSVHKASLDTAQCQSLDRVLCREGLAATKATRTLWLRQRRIVSTYLVQHSDCPLCPLTYLIVDSLAETFRDLHTASSRQQSVPPAHELSPARACINSA